MIRPSPSAYREAVQNPAVAFAHPDLQRALTSRDPLGLPLAWSGAFATIFRLELPGQEPLALRCFTQEVAGLGERYQAMEAFREACPQALGRHLLQTVLLEQGIWVEGAWHPVIVMPWCAGMPLDPWAAAMLRAPDRLRGLQQALRALAAASEAAGFLHGDLQHGNILVDGQDKPILVDYDNVFPPGCAHLPRTTAGLPSFRHPGADGATPVLALDRFAQLILHAALEILIQAPELFEARKDIEGLVFRAADLKAPRDSALFHALAERPGLAPLGQALTRTLAGPAGAVPALVGFLRQVQGGGRSQPKGPWPDFGAATVQALDRLYGPQGRLASPPPQWAPGNAACAARGAQPPNPGLAARRWRWPRRLALGLGLLVAWQAWGPPLPALGRGLALFRGLGTQRGQHLAEVRATAQRALGLRKDQLITLVVTLDNAREDLQGIPDEVMLAVQDPRSEEVRSTTVGALRRDLGQTRETARRALLRCDEILVEIDALIASGGAQGRLSEQLAAIKGLPDEARARIGRRP